MELILHPRALQRSWFFNVCTFVCKSFLFQYSCLGNPMDRGAWHDPATNTHSLISLWLTSPCSPPPHLPSSVSFFSETWCSLGINFYFPWCFLISFHCLQCISLFSHTLWFPNFNGHENHYGLHIRSSDSWGPNPEIPFGLWRAQIFSFLTGKQEVFDELVHQPHYCTL